ncbi:MAG TPA: PHB depolymerase family esterase, partial [Leptolyngbya sp.]|nr:PHB depolymerase family esterase [Leptolyngbya sp.]
MRLNFTDRLAKQSAIALSILTTACSAVSSAPQISQSAQTSRTFVTHLPRDRQPTQPVPLVLVFHGYGSQGKDLEKSSGIDQIADRENFIVVYPDGLNKRWNVSGTEDVAFTNSIIQQFQQRYKIDPRRIYAAGVSNGGFLVQRLACES